MGQVRDGLPSCAVGDVRERVRCNGHFISFVSIGGHLFTRSWKRRVSTPIIPAYVLHAVLDKYEIP